MRRRPHPTPAAVQPGSSESSSASNSKENASTCYSRVRCKRALVYLLIAGLYVFLLVSFHEGAVQDVHSYANLASSYLNPPIHQSIRQLNNDTAIVVDTSGLNIPSSNECVTATLLLFGVPKEFQCIWNHYIKYIVNANPAIQFEAHIHLYSDLHSSSFTNTKNNELNVTIDSPAVIRSIIDGTYHHKADKNTTKIPTRLVTSSQKEYDKKNLSWIEQRDAQQFEPGIATISTLKNVFRQGNSMYEAYLSSISHPFYNNPTSPSNKTFLFLRSDTLLIEPIIIPCQGLDTNEIHIPSWQTKDFPEYNDRTAMAGFVAAEKYARAKSHVFPQILLDRRNTQGKQTIQWSSYPSMKQYQKGRLYNPERMLKVYLDHRMEDIGTKLLVKEREVEWAPLVRVRSGGFLADMDVGRWKTPKHLNQSNYCSR